MTRYMVVAFLRGCLIVVVTLALVFVMLRLIPSDPAEMLLRREATREQIAYVRSLWGLDQPIHVQFWLYIQNLMHGDAGISYQFSRDPGSTGIGAFDLVMSRFPATIQLAFTALALSVLVSVPLGALTALKKNSFIDHFVMVATLAVGSLPSFLVSILLIVVFALNLRLLPTGGIGTPQHIVLPAIALTLHFSVILTRLTRTEVGRALASDYVVTARSKGLPNNTVIWRHVMKNAALPLITITGLRLGTLLHGSVIVETVFAWPGIGRLMIESIGARDYPVIQVIVPVAAVVFVSTNFLVDMLYAIMDPRVRLMSK